MAWFMQHVSAVLYHAWLRPLIARDYRLRKAGLRPDRMHWADNLAGRLGLWFRADYPE